MKLINNYKPFRENKKLVFSCKQAGKVSAKAKEDKRGNNTEKIKLTLNENTIISTVGEKATWHKNNPNCQQSSKESYN